MTEPALERSIQPVSPADPPTAGAADAVGGWPGPGGGVSPGGSTTPDGAVAAEGVATADGTAPAEAREEASPATACTQAQQRRFLKSRPYVPLHEWRRRVGLTGEDDDVAPVDLDDRRIFVGLPSREAGLLGELLRHGEVGYELLLDPTSPLVIGVFPMRPVQRA